MQMESKLVQDSQKTDLEGNDNNTMINFTAPTSAQAKPIVKPIIPERVSQSIPDSSEDVSPMVLHSKTVDDRQKYLPNFGNILATTTAVIPVKEQDRQNKSRRAVRQLLQETAEVTSSKNFDLQAMISTKSHLNKESGLGTGSRSNSQANLFNNAMPSNPRQSGSLNSVVISGTRNRYSKGSTELNADMKALLNP